MKLVLTAAEACPNRLPHWFALTVKPQHERAVESQLKLESIETYLPLYKTTRRWSDRVKKIDLPLFPRYVFSRFDFRERGKVIRIPSVLSIVGFGGKPVPISQAEIDLVKLLADGGFSIRPWPFVQMGQRVRVRNGPLGGLEGILLREKTAYRVVVNLEMLNRAVSVEIERELLEPITDNVRSAEIIPTAMIPPGLSAVGSVQSSSQ